MSTPQPPKRPRKGADLVAVPDLAARRAPVKPEEPPHKRFRDIETAIAGGGSERDVLWMVRRRLARLLDDPNLSARDVASNSRRLLEVDRAIRAIDEAAGGRGDGIGAATGTDDAPFDGSV
jgi:hypothetical protein